MSHREARNVTRGRTLRVDDLARLEGSAADGEDEDVVETENDPEDDEEREHDVRHELELAVEKTLGNCGAH